MDMHDVTVYAGPDSIIMIGKTEDVEVFRTVMNLSQAESLSDLLKLAVMDAHLQRGD